MESGLSMVTPCNCQGTKQKSTGPSHSVTPELASIRMSSYPRIQGSLMMMIKERLYQPVKSCCYTYNFCQEVQLCQQWVCPELHLLPVWHLGWPRDSDWSRGQCMGPREGGQWPDHGSLHWAPWPQEEGVWFWLLQSQTEAGDAGLSHQFEVGLWPLRLAWGQEAELWLCEWCQQLQCQPWSL